MKIEITKNICFQSSPLKNWSGIPNDNMPRTIVSIAIIIVFTISTNNFIINPLL